MNLERLTSFSLRHSAVVLAIAGLLTATFGYGMGRATIVNGFRSYLGENNPDLEI